MVGTVTVLQSFVLSISIQTNWVKILYFIFITVGHNLKLKTDQGGKRPAQLPNPPPSSVRIL